MRFWLILASLVVFAAGAAAGALAFRASNAGGHDRRREPFFFGNDPFASLVKSEDVYEELGLDDRQKGMITHLLASHEKRVRDVFTSLQDLRSELREGIYAALSPTQRNQFDSIQKDLRAREVQSRLTFELANLKKELSLTAEEEGQVQGILLEYGLAKAELGQSSQDREVQAKSEDELRKSRDEKLKKVLPEAKFAKFLEVKGRWRGPPGRDRKFQPERPDRQP